MARPVKIIWWNYSRGAIPFCNKQKVDPLNHNSDTQYSRKNFLKRTALVGAIGLGASSILAYCGRRPEEEGGAADGGSGSAAACEDVASLSAAEKQQRDTMVQTLKYTPKSSDPTKLCSGCQLFKQPAAGAACGGCQLFPGPVAAEGYCASWAAKIG